MHWSRRHGERVLVPLRVVLSDGYLARLFVVNVVAHVFVQCEGYGGVCFVPLSHHCLLCYCFIVEPGVRVCVLPAPLCRWMRLSVTWGCSRASSPGAPRVWWRAVRVRGIRGSEYCAALSRRRCIRISLPGTGWRTSLYTRPPSL